MHQLGKRIGKATVASLILAGSLLLFGCGNFGPGKSPLPDTISKIEAQQQLESAFASVPDAYAFDVHMDIKEVVANARSSSKIDYSGEIDASDPDNLLIMRSTVVAEIVGNERRVFHDGLTALVFTVKGTERIDLGALNAVVTHAVRMIKNELLDLLAVCRTAFSIPHRINHEFQARCIKAQLFKELHEHDDGLGISGGI